MKMPDGAKTNAALTEIKRLIKAQGPMTFARFMDLALYFPVHGYYTSGRKPWGPEGDYITNIDVSPVFARTLAKQIAEMHAAIGAPDDFVLIEAGAGRALLSVGIYDSLKELSPSLYKSIEIKLVEKNSALAECTDKMPGNFSWHDDLAGLPGKITGCIISNELIDAMPVHRVVFQKGRLHEIYVGADESGLFDVIDEPSTSDLNDYFRVSGLSLEEGQVAEVNLAMSNWMTEAASIIDRGFIITVDYGVPARELYSPERGSTIHCHYRHTLNKDPYERVGEQDITAHVDFSALVRAGQQADAQLTGFTTQKNFLLGLGITDEAAGHGAMDIAGLDNIRRNRMIKELILPGGMGDIFKVLVMHKGIPRPELKGFSFRDMGKFL